MKKLLLVIRTVLYGLTGAIIVLSLLASGGCGDKTPIFAFSTLTVSPQNKVLVGGKVELSASTIGYQDGITYRFIASRGSCTTPEFPAALSTFCAPAEPCEVVIRVEAIRSGVVLATSSCKITVVSADAVISDSQTKASAPVVVAPPVVVPSAPQNNPEMTVYN